MLKLWILPIITFILTHGIRAANEGDTCEDNDAIGVCAALTTCESAKKALKLNLKIVVCDVVNFKAIVCCLDKPLSASVTTTTPSSTFGNSTDCPPIPAKLTSEKTGQKAWDKCLEYQEKYVYPCDDVMSLELGVSKARVNNCRRNAITPGQAVDFNLLPHMAILGLGGDCLSTKWSCSGSIISETFVLTSAYCVANNLEKKGFPHVLIGNYVRYTTCLDSNFYDVKRFIKHKKFKPPARYYDIALAKLDKSIPLSRSVVPACLHTEDSVNDAQAFGTGWPHSLFDGPLPVTSLKTIFYKIPAPEYALEYSMHQPPPTELGNKSLLFYANQNTSRIRMCVGDGGDPLQIRSTKISCMYMIVGVVSSGNACAITTEPGLYTSVAYFLSWIESIVWP